MLVWRSLCHRRHNWYPFAVGVNPQADHQPRITGWSPCPAFHRFNRRPKPAQVQPAHQFPNRPRRVLRLDQLFHIHGVQDHLLPIHALQFQLSADSL